MRAQPAPEQCMCQNSRSFSRAGLELQQTQAGQSCGGALGQQGVLPAGDGLRYSSLPVVV